MPCLFHACAVCADPGRRSITRSQRSSVARMLLGQCSWANRSILAHARCKSAVRLTLCRRWRCHCSVAIMPASTSQGQQESSCVLKGHDITPEFLNASVGFLCPLLQMSLIISPFCVYSERMEGSSHIPHFISHCTQTNLRSSLALNSPTPPKLLQLHCAAPSGSHPLCHQAYPSAEVCLHNELFSVLS
jgi:hypothetical protein